MGEFSGGCWGAGAFADTDLSLNPAWLLQCFKLKKFNFKELFQSESTLRWNAKHHHQSRWKEFFRLTRPGALTNWRLMQDAQPQTTHPSYTLQRSCPVTKKKVFFNACSFILQARSTHRQNRASQSHASAARGEENREHLWSAILQHLRCTSHSAELFSPRRWGTRRPCVLLKRRRAPNGWWHWGKNWFKRIRLVWVSRFLLQPKAHLLTGNFRYPREVFFECYVIDI